jgi:Uma2 family endonuclease
MNRTLLQEGIALKPALAGVRMAPEEFDAAEDWEENYRYELIDGVLVVTPPPLEAERDPNGELDYLLRRYREDHPQGHTLDKTLSEQTVRTRSNRRRADRVIWAGLGRVPDPLVDVPTIVAEFVSADKRDWLRDYVEKRLEYMEIGVAEYWVIDRFRRVMTVYRHQPEGPLELEVKENEIYCTPLLPGFELPLGRLFLLADSWKQGD